MMKSFFLICFSAPEKCITHQCLQIHISISCFFTCTFYYDTHLFWCFMAYDKIHCNTANGSSDGCMSWFLLKNSRQYLIQIFIILLWGQFCRNSRSITIAIVKTFIYSSYVVSNYTCHWCCLYTLSYVISVWMFQYLVPLLFVYIFFFWIKWFMYNSIWYIPPGKATLHWYVLLTWHVLESLGSWYSMYFLCSVLLSDEYDTFLS